MNFNIIATIASLIAGILYFFPGEILYRALRGHVPGPVLISLYFLGLALCVFLVIFILSKILGNYRHLHYTFKQTIAVVLLFTFLGVPLISAGCEFLYELGISEAAKPKNFVFLIDNSGSMEGNDPTDQRFSVVEDIANTLPADSVIGIYTFESITTEVYKTGSAVPGSIQIPPAAISTGGGTALYSCIDAVANELTPEMTKSATKFIVLTDGDPGDSNMYRTAVQNCNSKNISVSCVGFGQYNKATFIDLANRTGGNFMAADDVSQLKTSVTEAIEKNPINRDLISSRNDATSNSTLYAILRVVLLIIIGLVFAYLKYLNAALSKFSLPFFIACCVSSLLGGIFVEAFYHMYLIESFGRLILCLAFAFTPLLSNSYYSSLSGANTKTTSNTPYPSASSSYSGNTSYPTGSGKNYF